MERHEKQSNNTKSAWMKNCINWRYLKSCEIIEKDKLITQRDNYAISRTQNYPFHILERIFYTIIILNIR